MGLKSSGACAVVVWLGISAAQSQEAGLPLHLACSVAGGYALLNAKGSQVMSTPIKRQNVTMKIWRREDGRLSIQGKGASDESVNVGMHEHSRTVDKTVVVVTNTGNQDKFELTSKIDIAGPIQTTSVLTISRASGNVKYVSKSSSTKTTNIQHWEGTCERQPGEHKF